MKTGVCRVEPQSYSGVHDGKQDAVQGLWSNNSLEGAGYCAGDDFPVTG